MFPKELIKALKENPELNTSQLKEEKLNTNKYKRHTLIILKKTILIIKKLRKNILKESQKK